jgi:arylformamidase
MINLDAYRLIDLTLTYDQRVAGYSWQTARELEKDGWNARYLHLYSHAGTHMDAPTHFGVGDLTIDAIAPETFIGRAWLLDVSVTRPSQLIEASTLSVVQDKWRAGDSLLIRSGWSHHIGQGRYRMALPRLSESFARWCVSNSVKMLGVEPPSIADVRNLEELTRIHRILLEGGVTIVEGLTGLENISQSCVTLLAFPLKIAGGDGAPARVFALEDRQTL